MATAGNTYTITLKKAHLEWGTHRYTGTRAQIYGEGYLPIPKARATAFGVYNSNQTGGTDVLGVNIFNANTFSCLQIPTEYDIKGIEIKLDKKTYINRAHRRNISVQFWTINDKEEMRRLIEMGADVIMTDNPDVMYELLVEMGYYN